MKRLSEPAFLKILKPLGIEVGDGYPKVVNLSFDKKAGDARYWALPMAARRFPFFCLTILELLGEWQVCYAWRHMGGWPEKLDPDRINDCVEFHILRGLAMPCGTTDAIGFEREEVSELVTLMFSSLVFGWSVGEDLSIVPDHGRYIVQTDHHDVIHVIFRDEEECEPFAEEMESRGFAVPTEAPDATFKAASWMDKGDDC